MAQLDYMEKRGSGLKRICNETRALESYKENRKPVFKSSVAQFMTTIYSMEYDQAGNETGNAVGKDAGYDAGYDAGNDTGNVGIPDKYVLRLLRTIGKQTLTVRSMMEMLELKGDDNFRKTYLNPAINDGYITLLYPDKPRKKGQAYFLTEKGLKLWFMVQG